jgi:hypothetical protein
MVVHVLSKGPDVLTVSKAGPTARRGMRVNTTARTSNEHGRRVGLGGQNLARHPRRERDERCTMDQGECRSDRPLEDQRFGMPIATILEAFLQCRFKPCYEGFASQKL